MTRVDHSRMANAIRALAMDAVEKAKSGHPGLPMGAADVATVWSSLSGLKFADEAEQQALARIFAGRTSPEILSPKVFIGEPMGAGAPLGMALAMEGWSRGERPGPALVNSSSLGGTHFSIVVAPATAPSVGQR